MQLLAAVPDLNATKMPEGIPGVAPRPGHRPDGCAFAPRCPWAIDKCRAEIPPLEPFAGGQVACWRAREVFGNESVRRETAPCRFLRPSDEGELSSKSTVLAHGTVNARVCMISTSVCGRDGVSPSSVSRAVERRPWRAASPACIRVASRETSHSRGRPSNGERGAERVLRVRPSSTSSRAHTAR